MRVTAILGNALNVILRIVLGLAGLVFLVSLLAAAGLMLLLWLLRALMCKLTGQPVQAWTFRFNQQTLWRHFRQGSGDTPASQAPRTTPFERETVLDDVTDVEPKRIDPSGR